MITVKFSITELAGKFTITTPKLYLWFAYFWGDIHTLSTPNPVSVFVQPASDTRDAYPDFDQALVAVPIPPAFGSFQANLDDAGAGLAAAGVLVLVLGQHDTPDDAISAGYSAFGSAVSQQLNSYVQSNGLVAPSPDQVATLSQAIRDSVTSAISNKLSDWDKFLTWVGQETQDEFIGYSYAFFGPGQLNPPQHNTPLNLPPIENQIEYTFPLLPPNNTPSATLSVQTLSGPDPCQSLVIAVNQATVSLTNVMKQLHQLQSELAAASPVQKAVIRIEIKEIQNTTLPAAQKVLADAQRALQRCRLINGMLAPNLGLKESFKQVP